MLPAVSSSSTNIETIFTKAVDADPVVLYDSRNTGKEVILKFMSSNHSEVAAA